MANQTLQKLNHTRFDWPRWKQYLFLALVFALGILIGRLMIDRLQLVAGIVAVLGAMALVFLSERKSQPARGTPTTASSKKRGK